MNSLKLFKQKRLVAKKSDFSDIYQSNYNIFQPFFILTFSIKNVQSILQNKQKLSSYEKGIFNCDHRKFYLLLSTTNNRNAFILQASRSYRRFKLHNSIDDTGSVLCYNALCFYEPLA